MEENEKYVIQPKNNRIEYKVDTLDYVIIHTLFILFGASILVFLNKFTPHFINNIAPFESGLCWAWALWICVVLISLFLVRQEGLD
jgi:hypothetical protein